MPRRRATGKRKLGRERYSDELEQFLAGDDSVLSNEALLQDLAAEVYFAQDEANFSASERKRLDLFGKRYRNHCAEEDERNYRELAEKAGILSRYLLLLKHGEEPSAAFAQAVSPGPNSIVRDIPRDGMQLQTAARFLGRQRERSAGRVVLEDPRA